jgi:hypothetical protein
MNSKNIKTKKSPPRKDLSKRDRMLQFASSIKKPKVMPSPERFAIEFGETIERNKQYELEVNDQKLRLEKEKIRMIYQL